MSAMGPRLRVPFPSLSADNLLSRGSAGHIFQISPHVVFKCATQFDDPHPQQAEEMEESIKKIEAEKAIYQILMERPHPSLIQCLLCVPEGIFMRRMEGTLEERLSRATLPRTQERWGLQLTSATAWLEHLGLVHGDLRPANILLDARENIHLADFDATVRSGEELLVASELFLKLVEPPVAGPVTEQFSLASCIYNIRFGHWPWSNLELEAGRQKWIRGEFPLVSTDHLFGEVIRRCWHGEYESVAAVEKEIRSNMTPTGIEDEGVEEVADDVLRIGCEEWVRTEIEKQMAKASLP